MGSACSNGGRRFDAADVEPFSRSSNRKAQRRRESDRSRARVSATTVMINIQRVDALPRHNGGDNA
jgi:hypothetical protein